MPAVEGDDDETTLTPAVRSGRAGPARAGATARRRPHRHRERDPRRDARSPVSRPRRRSTSSALAPLQRLRVLAALTSNVALNSARTIATRTDQNVSGLIVLQVVLGVGGLLVSLLLAVALIAATRRQTAHFRSLVTRSTDLVLVFGARRLPLRERLGDRDARPRRRRRSSGRGSSTSSIRTTRRRSAPPPPTPSRTSSSSGSRTSSENGATSRRTSPISETTGASAAPCSTHATSPSASGSRRS